MCIRDRVTAGLIYCTSETQRQSTRVGHLEQGVATATEQAETVIEAQDLIKNEFNALELRLDEATKQNEALKKGLSIIQLSATGLKWQNLPML